ncbi:MAG TPA: DUF4232 domain-containing protein [Candidatus Saccharimonadia bacterium]|jgi:archaellum component FlaG (FlaF/FlaG flagellin family)
MKRAVLVVALLVAMGAAAFMAYANNRKPTRNTITPAPSATMSTSPRVAECQTSVLAATLTSSGGAAGTIYYSLALKNTGAKTCTERGYPGVSLVDGSGSMLGQPATRNSSVTPQTITLSPGASVYAQVGVPNAGNFGPGQCSANSAALRVYPPDQTQYLQVNAQLQSCPGFSTTALSSTQH